MYMCHDYCTIMYNYMYIIVYIIIGVLVNPTILKPTCKRKKKPPPPPFGCIFLHVCLFIIIIILSITIGSGTSA